MKPIEVYDRNTKERLAFLRNAYEIEYTLQLNSVWTGSFTMPYHDNKRRYCESLNLIKLWDINAGEDDQFIGLFRIISITENSVKAPWFANYEIEHVMGTLMESSIVKFRVLGGTGYENTRRSIEKILDYQTEVKWILGECDFDEHHQYEFREINLLQALYTVVSRLHDNYYWTFNTTTFPWVLNLKQVSNKPVVDVRYKKNIFGIEKLIDPRNICTKLYVYGKELSPPDPSDPGDGDGDGDGEDAPPITWPPRVDDPIEDPDPTHTLLSAPISEFNIVLYVENVSIFTNMPNLLQIIIDPNGDNPEVVNLIGYTGENGIQIERGFDTDAWPQGTVVAPYDSGSTLIPPRDPMEPPEYPEEYTLINQYVYPQSDHILIWNKEVSFFGDFDYVIINYDLAKGGVKEIAEFVDYYTDPNYGDGIIVVRGDNAQAWPEGTKIKPAKYSTILTNIAEDTTKIPIWNISAFKDVDFEFVQVQINYDLANYSYHYPETVQFLRYVLQSIIETGETRECIEVIRGNPAYAWPAGTSLRPIEGINTTPPPLPPDDPPPSPPPPEQPPNVPSTKIVLSALERTDIYLRVEDVTLFKNDQTITRLLIGSETDHPEIVGLSTYYGDVIVIVRAATAYRWPIGTTVKKFYS